MHIQSSVKFKIYNAKSRVHGTGAFASEPIPAKKKIGNLGGKLISKRAARKKAADMGSISIIELWNGKAIDASAEKGLRYINHSCEPNTFLRNFNNHVEFYALRDIRKNEELTCDYGETHHDGTLPCNCKAPGCKGKL